MTGMPNLPTSGYGLERVYAPRQVYEVVEGSADHPASEDNVTLGWDWQITGEDTFDVIVTVHCDPSPARAERVDVAVVGCFAFRGDARTVELLEFARIHAPSILMPYAREIIASLTGRGPMGAIHLPPMNVKVIMDRMDPAIATGARQLHDNPALLRFRRGMIAESASE